MLTDDMIRLIREQRLGFVATVNPDGTPNLSPKGTFVVMDEATVAFAEIRSPGTMRNIRDTGSVEVNFIDCFTRRGCRIFGRARVVRRGEPGFDGLLVSFSDHGRLVPRIRAIILISIARAATLTSPAYDDGASETTLRKHWTERFRALQPDGHFAE